MEVAGLGSLDMSTSIACDFYVMDVGARVEGTVVYIRFTRARKLRAAPFRCRV
jgi:hypothetical protein